MTPVNRGMFGECFCHCILIYSQLACWIELFHLHASFSLLNLCLIYSRSIVWQRINQGKYSTQHEASMNMTLKTNSFWNIVSAEGVQANPLGYYCAPNHADPSYASARTIEDFIAFGFTRCWLDESNFSNWHLMERGDVQWLREYFLQSLEFIVTAIYTGDVNPGDFQNDDWAGFDSLTIGNEEAGEDETHFTWIPERVDSDSILMVLNTNLGDDDAIWLSLDAIRDMRRVRAAIAFAREINGKGQQGEGHYVTQAWKKVGVPNVSKKKPTNESFFDLYGKKYGSTIPKRFLWTA